MPLLVNGELLPEEWVRQALDEALQEPHLTDITDPLERSMVAREAAEQSAVSRLLLKQAEAKFAPSISADELEREMARSRSNSPDSADAEPAGEQSRREDLRSYLALQAAAEALVGPIAKPRKTEIVEFYNTRRHLLREPEKARLRHIFRKLGGSGDDQIRLDLSRALGELERGVSFADVVARYSDDKRENGELGWVRRGSLGPEFDAIVFAMRPGERSPVFETPAGFHIVEVLELQPARTPELAELRPRLQAAIEMYRMRERLGTLLEGLRAKAQIRRISNEEAAQFRSLAPSG